jgi:Cytochrome c7 and related cytochrome c
LARTERTTKKLAQRIELSYFKRAHPLRRWRFVLSVAAPVTALLWLGSFAVGRNNRPYTSGKMSAAHAVLTQRCGECHVSPAGAFRTSTSDTACLSCHDGPIHHATQVFPPRCSSCHVEHRGRGVRLASTADAGCTRCHAQLEVRSGSPAYQRSIGSFNQQHPEFRALLAAGADPGTIVFLHSVHMKADLAGPAPGAKRVQLACHDCHRTPAANREEWPYGTAQGQASPPKVARDPLAVPPARAYMVPVSYATACAACHSLQFDARNADQVPHDTPQVIDKFLREKYPEYVRQHPELLREAPASALELPGRGIAPAEASRPVHGIEQRIAETERLLWAKTCKQCHQLSFSPGAALPAVAASRIRSLWMPHAKFDHAAHQMLTCLSCHVGAAAQPVGALRDAATRETPVALLPGIKTCQQCHKPGAESAEPRCFECHRYHDWTQRNEVKGKITIPWRTDLAKMSPAQSPAVAISGNN